MEKLKKENGGIKLITLISIILGVIIVLFVLAEYTINVKKDINEVSVNNQTNASGNKQISEQKSEEIINEKYQLASKLINLDSTYFDISKNPIEKNNSDNVKGYYYKINNYEEICDKYLTSECKKYFDEKAICLVWIQNEAYIAEGGASPSQNGGIEFYNINTTESEISATVRMTIIEPDTNNILGFAENTFKLVLENEEWKIAEYKSEYELENWSQVVWYEELPSQNEEDVNQDMALQIEGDINQDGKADKADLEILSNYMANYNDETNTSSVQLTEKQKEIADVNKDGTVNGKDVMMLSRNEEVATKYELGDVNQDGKLSQEDVDLLYDYVRGVAQLNEIQKELADIIKDGKINTRDVSKLSAIVKASEFEKGDINQDGKVDKADLEILSNYMANYNDETNTSSVQLTSVQRELADVNKDGTVNGKDVMMLSRNEEVATKYELGDVNQDGKLSQEDVDLLYDYVRGVAQLNETQKELADIIKDGKINTRDVSKLSAIIKASEFEKGDINQDGKVDKADLEILSNYMANYNDEKNTSSVQLTSVQRELADVNQDGTVNGKDVMMLSRKVQ